VPRLSENVTFSQAEHRPFSTGSWSSDRISRWGVIMSRSHGGDFTSAYFQLHYRHSFRTRKHAISHLWNAAVATKRGQRSPSSRSTERKNQTRRGESISPSRRSFRTEPAYDNEVFLEMPRRQVVYKKTIRIEWAALNVDFTPHLGWPWHSRSTLAGTNRLRYLDPMTA